MIDNQVCNVLRMVVIKLSASRHKAITVYICLWWIKSNTVYPIKGSNSIGQPLSMGNEGEPSREQICHSVFTLSSNTFCWFSWESCSQTKLCCSFSCWSLAFLIWNCSSSFAALSFRIWKMQNELVKAFESDYSSCTSMQDLPPTPAAIPADLLGQARQPHFFCLCGNCSFSPVKAQMHSNMMNVKWLREMMPSYE